MKKRIVDKGKTKRAISAETFAEALGAEDTGIAAGPDVNPVSIYALHRFLAGSLQSTGGRPRLAGTSSLRRKISLFDEDVAKLEKLSRYLKEKEGLNVSSSQIASALVHAGISGIDDKKLKSM